MGMLSSRTALLTEKCGSLTGNQQLVDNYLNGLRMAEVTRRASQRERIRSCRRTSGTHGHHRERRRFCRSAVRPSYGHRRGSGNGPGAYSERCTGLSGRHYHVSGHSCGSTVARKRYRRPAIGR